MLTQIIVTASGCLGAVAFFYYADVNHKNKMETYEKERNAAYAKWGKNGNELMEMYTKPGLSDVDKQTIVLRMIENEKELSAFFESWAK